MKKRLISGILAVATVCSMLTGMGTTAFAETQRTGNQNYFTNQGRLMDSAFAQLPLGAVQGEAWIEEQLLLQKHGLTGAMQDFEGAFADYGSQSAWQGGNGDSWENGPYYFRGLTALAWTLDDQELKAKAMKWIDWVLDNQRDNGFFGPLKDGDGINTSGWDWWPRMVVISTIRDYYEATEREGTPDPRVLPFFEKYFRFQEMRLPSKPLSNHWAEARGGDNMEVVLWYYNRVYDPRQPEQSDWLIDLVHELDKSTFNWSDIFTDTTVRHHVVNTTQAMKMPAVRYQVTGDDRDRNALREGIFNMGIDHGRIDNMASADEQARDNLPYRGTETCGVVESLLSNEINLRILGDSWIGDELELVAYNNLPASMTPDFNRRCYFQSQNQATITQGWGEYDSDGGESAAFTAADGTCCLGDMHMGWPKLVQNMWMATPDNGLAAVVYGPNRVTAQVANGRTAVFTQETNYPFEGSIKLTYEGEAASFPLVLRVPQWCKAPVFQVNGEEIFGEIVDGYFTIDRAFTAGDVVKLSFPMELETSTWYNNTAAIKRGPLYFVTKVEEDWRVTTDDDAAYAGGFRSPKEYPVLEVYPASKWNYALYLDHEKPGNSFEITIADKIPLQPFTTKTAPVTLKAKGQEIPEWQMLGNVVPEPPFSPIAPDESRTEEITLVPYGCTKLRMTQIPVVGKAKDTVVRSIRTAKVKQQNGEKVIEFDNIIVPPAENYQLKIHYSGKGQLHMNINSKYEQDLTFQSGGNPIVIDDLYNIVPGDQAFRFSRDHYNTIRFFGDADVSIDHIEVIPVRPFEKPEIRSAVVNKDSVMLNTNVTRSNGFYTVQYGTESGNYTHTASGFRSNIATITGLDMRNTYYFRISMVVNGRTVESDEIAAQANQPVDIQFQDDFSDPEESIKNWTEYDPDNVIHIEPGKIVLGNSSSTKIVTGEESWADYTVEATVKAPQNNGNNYGIMFRATNITEENGNKYSGYYAGIGVNNGGLNITLGYLDGDWHFLKDVPFPDYQAGQAYTLKVVVNGNRIGVFVDGKLKLTYEDSRCMVGKVGLRSWTQPFECSSFEVRNSTDEELLALGLEPSGPKTYFEDDFSDPEQSAQNWTEYDPDNIIEIQPGKLVAGNSENSKIVTGEESWTDYTVEAKVKGPDNGNNFGIMLRATNIGEGDSNQYSGYYVGLGFNYGVFSATLGKCNNDWFAMNVQKFDQFMGKPYQPGQEYTLKAVVNGTTIGVFIDDTLIINHEDSDWSFGKVGLRSWTQPFECSYFKVRESTPEELAALGIGDPPSDPPIDPDFQEDFEKQEEAQARWSLLGETDKISIADGKLTFTPSENTKAVAGSEEWTDYVVESTVRLHQEGGDAGMIFRVTGAESGTNAYNGYYFGIRKGVASFGYADGEWHHIRDVAMPVAIGQDHKLKAVVSEDRIALYVDDALVLKYYDDRYSKGQIGFRSYLTSLSAEDISVRLVRDEDLTVFRDGMKTITGAYESAVIKYSKIRNAGTYKIMYGTESGKYTHSVYDVTYNTSLGGGNAADKTAFSGLENDTTYYVRLVGLQGNKELETSDEFTVKTGTFSDVGKERDTLMSLVETIRSEEKQDAYSAKAWDRLQETLGYADQMLSDVRAHKMDLDLAVSMLSAAVAEKGTPVPTEPTYLKVRYNASAKLDVAGDMDERYDFPGYYEGIIPTGGTARLRFTPYAEGREFAGVFVNGSADSFFEKDQYVCQVSADGTSVSLEFDFTIVNKLVLNTAIQYAQEAQSGGEYASAMPTVQKRFDKALAAAVKVAEAKTADQKAIDKAWSDLIDVIHLLQFQNGDMSALELQLHMGSLLDSADYTTESWNAYLEVRECAQAMFDAQDSLQEEIDTMVKGLKEAISSLVFAADKRDLQNLVDEADHYDLDDYLEIGKEAFSATLQAARELLTDVDATNRDYNVMLVRLTSAMADLRRIPDKEALDALLARFETINSNIYTAESYAAYRASVDALKKLINRGASVEEIGMAYYEALEKEDALTHEPSKPDTGKPGKGSSGRTYQNDSLYGDEGKVLAGIDSSAATPSILSDTTSNFTLKRGSAYCFKMTVANGSDFSPSFTVGNGAVLKTQFVAQLGSDFYYRVWAVGMPGQSTGVYTALLHQKPQKHCTVTIA